MSYVRRQRLSWARIKLSCYSAFNKHRIAVSIFKKILSMYSEYYLDNFFSISLHYSFLETLFISIRFLLIKFYLSFLTLFFTLSRLFILVVLLPLFIGFSKFIVYFSMCFLSSQFHLSGTNLIVLYLITYVNTFFELFKSFFVTNFSPKKCKIIN